MHKPADGGSTWTDAGLLNQQLDPSFGNAGLLTADMGSTADTARSILHQDDGKTIVAGGGGPSDNLFFLARYNGDGTPDATFNSTGTITLHPGQSVAEGEAAVLQPDGKIVVGGMVDHLLGLMRFNADGTLDTTFGTNGTALAWDYGGWDGGMTLALQNDGSIIVAGNKYDPSYSRDVAVTRFTSAGAIDRTFGTNGYYINSTLGGDGRSTDVMVDDSGRIVVTATSFDQAYSELIALTPAGQLDTTFGPTSNGIAPIPNSSWGGGSEYFATAQVLEDGSGRYIIAGTGDTHSLLARLSHDGTVDTSFQVNGTEITWWEPQQVQEDLAIALDGQGRIVVAGGDWTGQQWTAYVMRFEPDGSWDSTFGQQDATQFVSFGPFSTENDTFDDLSILPDDSLMIAGTAHGDVALARIMPDNTLDVAPAVADLSATAVSTGEIDLTWTVNATNATSIELDRSTDAGVTWTQLTTNLPGNASSYNDTAGLSAGSMYSYRVAASLPNNAPSTPATASASTLPSAPVHFTVTGGSVTTNGVTLTWDPSPGALGYVIERSDDGGATFVPIDQVDGSTNTYTDTAAADGSDVLYHVIAIGDAGDSDASDPISAHTPLSAASNLQATAVVTKTTCEVDLSWDSNSLVADQYRVERSTDGGQTFSPIATISDLVYNDAAAPRGVALAYRVFAVTASDTSPASNVVSVRTVGDLQLVDDAATPDTGQTRKAYTIPHGQTLTISIATDGVLANDADPNSGQTMSIQSHTPPGSGTLTLNNDGTFTYAPNDGFVGTDTFTYTATDGLNATSNTATVTINVTDAMPEASTDTYLLQPEWHQNKKSDGSDDYGGWYTEDSVSGNLPASDPDGDPLTFTILDAGGNGSFQLLDPSTGAFIYTPTEGFDGIDLVTFTASDGSLTSNIGSLAFGGGGAVADDPDDSQYLDGDIQDGEWIYQPLPRPGGNKHYTTDEGQSLNVQAPGLLLGAADADPASTDVDQLTPGALFEKPQNGTVTIQDDGSFTYKPNAGFTGRDWFTWQIHDGGKGGGYATAFIDVQPNPPVLLIDANNDDGLNVPTVLNTPPSEQRLFMDASKPGKIVQVNDQDKNADGVPDYAEGYSVPFEDIPGGYAPPTQAQGAGFTPISVVLPTNLFLSTDQIQLTFGYGASDPSQVGRNGDGSKTPYTYQPASGGDLRIWTKDEDQQRDPASVLNGGNWVKPQETIDSSKLTWNAGAAVLYVEAVASLSESDWITVHIADVTTGQTLDGVVQVNSVAYDAAVDASRDGTLSFNADGFTPPTQPYRFWLNDNHDGKERSSDWDISTFLLPTEHSVVESSLPGGPPDWRDSQIQGKRDLEDFSRFQIQLTGQELFDQVSLEFTNVSEGSPEVRLWSALLPDNSYLTNTTAANQQVNSSNANPRVAVISSDAVRTFSKFDFDRIFQSRRDGSTSNYWFIFEGMHPGSGALTVTFTRAGRVVGQARVYMSLHNVDQMFEHYSADSADNPDAQNMYGTFRYTSSSPETNDYILYVHGWNMSPDDKIAFSDTAYKRLFWQGYKGRFGFFSWPTNYTTVSGFWATTWAAASDKSFTENYDNSEYKAFESAKTLKDVLTALNAKYPDHVNVLGHSMGNVVVSEALRLQVLSGGPPIINTYVASQASTVAEAYNKSAPRYAPLDSDIPDLYGGYFSNIGLATLWFVNFYNPQDWALGRGTWIRNQSTKPDAGFFYDSHNTIFGIEALYAGETISRPRITLSPGRVDDLYQIFAHIDPARTRALGVTPSIGGPITGQLDLSTVLGFGNRHWYHSGEFESTNMEMGPYWALLLRYMAL